jgi:hypothetical protein
MTVPFPELQDAMLNGHPCRAAAVEKVDWWDDFPQLRLLEVSGVAEISWNVVAHLVPYPYEVTRLRYDGPIRLHNGDHVREALTVVARSLQVVDTGDTEDDISALWDPQLARIEFLALLDDDTPWLWERVQRFRARLP